VLFVCRQDAIDALRHLERKIGIAVGVSDSVLDRQIDVGLLRLSGPGKRNPEMHQRGNGWTHAPGNVLELVARMLNNKVLCVTFHLLSWAQSEAAANKTLRRTGVVHATLLAEAGSGGNAVRD
jgi:hypothetical protein